MTLRDWVRQAHRWLGIILTLAILTNFVAIAFGPPPEMIVYAPPIPLALLIASGFYMFVRPYLTRVDHEALES